VGVTTAPREPSYLWETISNIKAAGWPELTICAEAGHFSDELLETAVADEEGLSGDTVLDPPDTLDSLPTTCRGYPLHFNDGPAGPWPNLLSTIGYLIDMSPRATHLLVAQDDIAIAANLRSWLERQRPVLEAKEVVNLFTCRQMAERRGWHLHRGIKQMKLGAQCYVIPREIGEHLLQAPPDSGASVVTADFWFAKFLSENQYAMWYHSPSFVQHVGEKHSSLANPGGVMDCRLAMEWVKDMEGFR
jgi:hypothetical protein